MLLYLVFERIWVISPCLSSRLFDGGEQFNGPAPRVTAAAEIILWPNTSKWGWCCTVTKFRFCCCSYMIIGSFCHQNHSCIIFLSRVMINFRLLYWIWKIKNTEIWWTLKSYILLTSQWDKHKTIHANKHFQLFLQILSWGGGRNMCQRSSEAIMKKLTNIDLAAHLLAKIWAD